MPSGLMEILSSYIINPSIRRVQTTYPEKISTYRVPKAYIPSTLQYLNFSHCEPPIIKSSFPLFVSYKTKNPSSTENGFENTSGIY